MGSKAINMIGEVSGKLVVTGPAPTVGKRAYWMCHCECGNNVAVMGKLLRRLEVQSCGCLHAEQAPKNAKRLPVGEAARNQLYLIQKREAMKQRELQHTLTIEQFEYITQQNCYYCGVEPKQRHPKHSDRLNGCYTYNGIDRIDSDKGYILENCVPACGIHNRMKGTMSQAEFLEACRQVVEFYGKGVPEETPLQELMETA